MICAHVKTKHAPPNTSCTAVDVENVDVAVGVSAGAVVDEGVDV